jgi:hypothetical protein
MTERDFCYWLQGFVELTQGQTPNPAQWKSIQEHLATVFTKVTPPVGMPRVDPTPTISPAIPVTWPNFPPNWCSGQTTGINPDPRVVTIC